MEDFVFFEIIFSEIQKIMYSQTKNRMLLKHLNRKLKYEMLK